MSIDFKRLRYLAAIMKDGCATSVIEEDYALNALPELLAMLDEARKIIALSDLGHENTYLPTNEKEEAKLLSYLNRRAAFLAKFGDGK